jgi:hypothetical protein
MSAAGGAGRGRAERVSAIRGALAAGRAREALDAALALARVDARNPEILALAARAHLALGEHAQAVALATRALALGDHPEPRHLRADALRALGRTDEAIEDLTRARALTDLTRARALAPDLPHAQDALGTALAACLEEAGRFDEARAALAPIVARHAKAGRPLPAKTAYEHAKLLSHAGDQAGAVAAIDAAIPATGAGSTPFLMLLFLRAKALDRAGDHAAAWESAARAQASRKVAFDADAFVRANDAAIAHWTKDRVAALGDSGVADATAVFVAGMPRSGTTLVDQIVAAHPAGAGVGELDELERFAADEDSAIAAGRAPSDAKALARAARRYLDGIRALAPRATRIANKALGNARIAPHLARLLPATRTVHIERDPRDVAVSCFLGAFHAGRYAWTTRPEWCLLAWRESRRLMAHWRTVLDTPVLETRYERLVREGAPEMRRIVEFLGLEWDAGVERFHETRRTVRTLSYDQVSRPLYTGSIGRWRRFESALDGVDWPAYDADAE